MDLETKFLGTYTADSSNPFMACGAKDCNLTFPHEVGYTENHEWKHVLADFYMPDQSGK